MSPEPLLGFDGAHGKYYSYTYKSDRGEIKEFAGDEFYPADSMSSLSKSIFFQGDAVGDKVFALDTTAPAAPSVGLADDTGSSDSDNITGDGRLTVTGVAPGDKLEYPVTKGASPALVPKTEAEYANYIATAGSANYSVVVKVSDAAGNTASRTKTLTLNSDPVGKPTIDGTVKENETLTAMANAISDADVLGTFSYQWQADGKDISGATSSSCKLTDADVDKKITVQVSYTDGQGMIEKVTSAESVEVVNVNTDPVGKPTINVQPSADEITCDVSRISDDDGLGIFSYQWQADGKDISGATSGTFSMTDAEADKRISVQVSYKDRHGTNEEVTSGTLIYGRGGSGVVAGDSEDNRMYGGAGDDFLSGGSGMDQLHGEDGNDKLYGGAGDDILQGDAGNDIFIYEGNDGDDIITDFTLGEDVLDLRHLLVGYDSSSNLDDFLQVTIGSTGGTNIRIDSNGTAGGSSYTDVSIFFRGIEVTLDDLETNNSLLVM
ncbi:type I secretion C-terminal target domain-containing protein [Candidatus Vondammii sp. HM_W22]|uniref:type I secretion C-terminal target domain-containing protein n=1 Tax=Candidatus Vondammii sp. HM_W22 TaxID=2687299 RepID=UPI001F1473F0|nr:type I secretion C-terminal target domain-containing protein [Candidatus Vondammii sp. HM_W22]